jgi:predicted nucleic acid-binding protein
LPELFTKPTRERDDDQVSALAALGSWLDLRPVSRSTAVLAAALGAVYSLSAGDALHLATAVEVGADRFIAENSRDVAKSIGEIDVTYPADVADPGPPDPPVGAPYGSTTRVAL